MSTEPLRSPLALQQQLLQECTEMADFALTTGLPVPAASLEMMQSVVLSSQKRGADGLLPEEVKKLGLVHGQLVKLIAPATPRALRLMRQQAGRRLAFLGSVPFIQRMMVASIICLVVFIALSLSDQINSADNGNILTADGLPLLINEGFFMAAAGMGASFAALFQANRYITARSFEPHFEVTYWIKFFLGLIAGLILVTLVPIDQTAGHGMGRPTLAMLGGFSAAAVYRILNRMVETVESLVQGNNQDILATQERAAKARAAEEITQSRAKLVANISSLQRQIDGADTAQVRRQLDQFANALLTGADGEVLELSRQAPSREPQKEAAPAPPAPPSPVAAPSERSAEVTGAGAATPPPAPAAPVEVPAKSAEVEGPAKAAEIEVPAKASEAEAPANGGEGAAPVPAAPGRATEPDGQAQ